MWSWGSSSFLIHKMYALLVVVRSRWQYQSHVAITNYLVTPGMERKFSKWYGSWNLLREHKSPRQNMNTGLWNPIPFPQHKRQRPTEFKGRKNEVDWEIQGGFQKTEEIRSLAGFHKIYINKKTCMFCPWGWVMPEILLFGIQHQKLYFNCSLIYSYQL